MTNKDYVETIYNEEEKPITDYPSKMINILLINIKFENSKILELGCGRGNF